MNIVSPFVRISQVKASDEGGTVRSKRAVIRKGQPVRTGHFGETRKALDHPSMGTRLEWITD